MENYGFNSELMGFSGQGRVMLFMRELYKNMPELNMINKTVMNNMYREYIVLLKDGFDSSHFDEQIGRFDDNTYKMARIIGVKLNISNVFVLRFLKSLWKLSSSGKIPYYVWNPIKYKESEAAKKDILPKNKLLDLGQKAIQKSFGVLKIGLFGGGLILTAYIIKNQKR